MISIVSVSLRKWFNVPSPPERIKVSSGSDSPIIFLISQFLVMSIRLRSLLSKILLSILVWASPIPLSLRGLYKMMYLAIALLLPRCQVRCGLVFPTAATVQMKHKRASIADTLLYNNGAGSGCPICLLNRSRLVASSIRYGLSALSLKTRYYRVFVCAVRTAYGLTHSPSSPSAVTVQMKHKRASQTDTLLYYHGAGSGYLILYIISISHVSIK